MKIHQVKVVAKSGKHKGAEFVVEIPAPDSDSAYLVARGDMGYSVEKFDLFIIGEKIIEDLETKAKYLQAILDRVCFDCG